MSDIKEMITIHIDGHPTLVEKGCTVASALMRHGAQPFRQSPATGEARAPHCFMGVCYECLVEIDGVANRQGCLTQVQENMSIRQQQEAVAPPQYLHITDGTVEPHTCTCKASNNQEN